VFYLLDTKLGKNWQVVQTFDHIHLYNVSETSVPFNGPTYQEEDCCDQKKGSWQIVVDEPTTEMPLNRHNESGQMFEGSEIARLRKERPTHVCQSDSEDEDVDDTIKSTTARMMEMPQLRSTLMTSSCFFLVFMCCPCPNNICVVLEIMYCTAPL